MLHVDTDLVTLYDDVVVIHVTMRKACTMDGRQCLQQPLAASEQLKVAGVPVCHNMEHSCVTHLNRTLQCGCWRLLAGMGAVNQLHNEDIHHVVTGEAGMQKMWKEHATQGC